MSTDEVVLYYNKDWKKSPCSKDNWIRFFKRIKPTLLWVSFAVVVEVLHAADALPKSTCLVYGLHASQNETHNNFSGSMRPEFYYTPGSDANDPGNQVDGQPRTANAVAPADRSTFKTVRDPRFNYPYEEKRVIMSRKNAGLIIAVPWLLNLMLMRGTALWYYLANIFVCRVIVSTLKEGVGAIRPNFYQRCGFDDATGKCNDEEQEREGRVSFPSAHSAYTASAMAFWAWDWIALFSATWPKGRLHFPIFALIPMYVTFFIAFSRYVDYSHFPHDILAGIAIGEATAYFFFRLMREARKDAHTDQHISQKKAVDVEVSAA